MKIVYKSNKTLKSNSSQSGKIKSECYNKEIKVVKSKNLLINKLKILDQIIKDSISF